MNGIENLAGYSEPQSLTGAKQAMGLIRGPRIANATPQENNGVLARLERLEGQFETYAKHNESQVDELRQRVTRLEQLLGI